MHMIYEERERNLLWADPSDGITIRTQLKALHWADEDDSLNVVKKSPQLLLTKKDYLNAKNIKIYDGNMSPYSAKEIIEKSTDDEVVKICDMMTELSMDFKDDFFNWAKFLNGNSVEQIGPFMDDPKVGRLTLKQCGAGYSKLFVLYKAVITQPNILFLHNPSNGLHPNLAAAILQHLTYKSSNTKFIITDARSFLNNF